MNIVFKNVYNFVHPLLKCSMDRETECGRKSGCGITPFPFAIGLCLASSNLIRKEKNLLKMCEFLSIQDILFSIKCIVYHVEVEVEVVVSRSAPSLLDSCAFHQIII